MNLNIVIGVVFSFLLAACGGGGGGSGGNNGGNGGGGNPPPEDRCPTISTEAVWDFTKVAETRIVSHRFGNLEVGDGLDIKALVTCGWREVDADSEILVISPDSTVTLHWSKAREYLSGFSVSRGWTGTLTYINRLRTYELRIGDTASVFGEEILIYNIGSFYQIQELLPEGPVEVGYFKTDDDNIFTSFSTVPYFDSSDDCRSVGCPITGADLVTVNGVEWAQPRLFDGVTWDDLNAICPDGVCMAGGILKGYDMTGWNWASIDDVIALFNSYIGAPVLVNGGDSFEEVDSSWAPAFFGNGWIPNLGGLGYEGLFAATRSISTVSSDGPDGFVYVYLAGIVDCGSDTICGFAEDEPPGLDVVTTSTQPIDSFVAGGVWFFRVP